MPPHPALHLQSSSISQNTKYKKEPTGRGCRQPEPLGGGDRQGARCTPPRAGSARCSGQETNLFCFVSVLRTHRDRTGRAAKAPAAAARRARGRGWRPSRGAVPPQARRPDRRQEVLLGPRPCPCGCPPPAPRPHLGAPAGATAQGIPGSAGRHRRPAAQPRAQSSTALSPPERTRQQTGSLPPPAGLRGPHRAPQSDTLLLLSPQTRNSRRATRF